MSIGTHFSGVRGVSLAAVFGLLAVLLSSRSCAEGTGATPAGSGPGSLAAEPRRPGAAPGGEAEGVRFARREGNAPLPRRFAWNGDPEGNREDAAIPAVGNRSGPSALPAGPWEGGSPPRRDLHPASGIPADRYPVGADPAPDVRREIPFIRQGEFAVLILEAMRAPRPAWGWEPRAATCLLGAQLGCDEPEIVAFLRQYPFGEGTPEEALAGRPGPPIGPGERPVMPLSGWRIREFLTEGEMVEVLGQLGIRVFSSRPEEMVTWRLARRVLAKFHDHLVPAEMRVPAPVGPQRLRPPRGNPGPRLAMSPSIP